MITCNENLKSCKSLKKEKEKPASKSMLHIIHVPDTVIHENRSCIKIGSQKVHESKNLKTKIEKMKNNLKQSIKTCHKSTKQKRRKLIS